MKFLTLKQTYGGLSLMLFALIVAACGGTDPEETGPIVGDVQRGKTLFTQTGCIACHPLEEGTPNMAGPSVTHIATEAEEIINSPNYTGQATTAEEYLRESILDPNIYLVQGYNPIMSPNYKDILSRQEIEDLVVYLLTLE